jgi:hypothetical protein
VVPIPVAAWGTLWAEELFAHWEHDSFIFEDNPAHLTIGFSCACKGRRLVSGIPLSHLKQTPKAIQQFIQELKKRERIPGSPWFLHQEIRQGILRAEAEFRERIRDQLTNLERKLNNRVSPGRRAQLLKKKARLERLLSEQFRRLV